jgi:hypothetical protein
MHRPLTAHATRVSGVGLLAALLLAFAALAVHTSSARGDVIKPLVVLGPTTVLNGTAIVSGTVALPASAADLKINGQPVGLQADGRFFAIVNLAGQSVLSLMIRNLLSGETTTITIPLNTNIVGPGGLIGPSVLATLEQAAVTILKPLEGFKIVDGLPLRIEGSVLDKDKLASLTVNGIDVLKILGPDGGFAIPLPGTTKEVRVVITDRQSVSQETVFPVERTAGATGTGPPAGTSSPLGRTVEAAQAVGVRIASVRYNTRGIKRTKRFRVVITVKDRRGLLVRNAAVGFRSTKVRVITKNPQAKRTNIRGQSSFVLKVRNRSFGKRLQFLVIAKTPQAKQRKISSVRLPRLARRTAARR